MKRKYKYIIGGIFIFLILAAIALIWYLQPYQPMERVETIFNTTNQSISVLEKNWLVFKPEDTDINTGLIFYPGAKVEPKAYGPLAYNMAQAGYYTIIVPMPLNLAVLGVDKADKVIKEYSNINNWVIGGHSLGGAMAARYTYNNSNKVTGLILLASYPSQENDLSGKDLEVLSIYGGKDGITDLEKIEQSQKYLPDSTKFIKIKGGNHSQFGWYGFQSGDNEATISRENQQRIIVDSIREFLGSVK